MRRVLLSLIVVAAIATPTLAESFGERLQWQSVKVAGPKTIAAGSLYRVKGKVYCWTAAHVVSTGVSDDYIYTVNQDIFVDGVYSHHNETRARVIGYSPYVNGKDLAILELEDRNFGQAAIEIRHSTCLPGERIYCVGNPAGTYGQSISEGVLAYNGRHHNGCELDQGSFNYCPGYSGGSVFDADGKFIGVMSRGAGEGVALFVPVRVMRKWAISYTK
jgi:S1-C subfamily serine protease